MRERVPLRAIRNQIGKENNIFFFNLNLLLLEMVLFFQLLKSMFETTILCGSLNPASNVDSVTINKKMERSEQGE